MRSKKHSTRGVVPEQSTGVRLDAPFGGEMRSPGLARLVRGKKSKFLLAVIGITGICLVLFMIYRVFIAPDSSGQKTNIYSAGRYDTLKRTDAQSTDVAQVVGQYGPEYDAAITEITDSDPVKWDKVTLDKAYLCLLYAEQTGNYVQAKLLLMQIGIAQANGVDIYNNGWDITEPKLAKIRQNVDEKTKHLQRTEVKVYEGEDDE